MSEPSAPVPDDKDWTFVLERACPECGYRAAEIDVTALPALVRSAAASWAAALTRPDAATRPSPRVWSPLEYGCHVRDVLRIFAGRLDLMRTQDSPEFDNWDQDATALAERYWEQDPLVVADELRAGAEDNAAGWEKVRAEEWQRPGRRSNGSVFTVATLGRYFLHDLHHHLHDVGA